MFIEYPKPRKQQLLQNNTIYRRRRSELAITICVGIIGIVIGAARKACLHQISRNQRDRTITSCKNIGSRIIRCLILCLHIVIATQIMSLYYSPTLFVEFRQPIA